MAFRHVTPLYADPFDPEKVAELFGQPKDGSGSLGPFPFDETGAHYHPSTDPKETDPFAGTVHSWAGGYADRNREPVGDAGMWAAIVEEARKRLIGLDVAALQASGGVVPNLLAIQDLNGQTLGGGSYGGGGSGGISAQEQAQRDLERLFAEKELDQTLRDIRGDYAPALRKSQAEIEETRRKQGKDLGIYGRLMAELPRIYRNAGALTDQNYRKARRALAEEDSESRRLIDQTFGGADGRVRAMVMVVSKESPEAADELAAGIDEIADQVDRGLVSDEAGFAAVLDASHQLAEAAVRAAQTATGGSYARDSEKLRIQYENTLADMVRERQAMLDARNNALRSAREWAALQAEQREARWALSDAARGSGGSGGPGGSNGPAGLWWGSEVPVTGYDFASLALNSLVSNPTMGVAELDRGSVLEIIRGIATSGMDFDTYVGALEAEGGFDANAELDLINRYRPLIVRAGLPAWQQGIAEYETHLSQPHLDPYGGYLAAYQAYRSAGYSDAEARRYAEQATGGDLSAWGFLPPDEKTPTVGKIIPTGPVDVQKIVSGLK